MTKALRADENIQRLGMAHVTYNVNVDQVGNSFWQVLSKVHLMACLPFKIVGFHYCSNNPIMKHPMAIMQRALSNSHRIRFRSHFGTFLIGDSHLQHQVNNIHD